MKRVWVNGTFDIVHLGHIKLLEYAKQQGDFLCVGIDSDFRVKQLKGPDRPLNNENARMEFISSIKYVDKVVLFSSDEELTERIRNFNPDFFVIGSDYRNRRIIGAEYADRILFFDKIEGYSSTGILNHSGKP
jgi:D-beta-D-heptose 7-phosphate kinase/D-beta-D-heptose 1-phosphate adenosyltransferase